MVFSPRMVAFLSRIPHRTLDPKQTEMRYEIYLYPHHSLSLSEDSCSNKTNSRLGYFRNVTKTN